MKRTTNLLIVFLVISIQGFSQEILCNPNLGNNKPILQINLPGVADIMSFQTLNRAVGNVVLTQQIGDQNKVGISQHSDFAGASTNQSFNFQIGNSNELTLGQAGSNNLLLSFQLGYLAAEESGNRGNHFGYGLDNGNGNAYAYGHKGTDNSYEVAGEGNKLTVTQDGNNNGVMAVQQGTDNSAKASQKGDNNYLMILQKGSNNTVSGYTQENTTEKISFDTVVQLGENLQLNATEESKSKQNGNKFTQSGDHLSLQVSNGFLNTLGGVEITQTGKDMKVVIDQSYFSFPMK